MFTSLYSLKYVTGAGMWVTGYFLCLAVCLGAAFAIRTNRGKTNAIIVITGVGLSSLLCDAAWFKIFFPDGVYRNMGLGGSWYGLLLLPLCLIIGLIIVTAINRISTWTKLK